MLDWFVTRFAATHLKGKRNKNSRKRRGDQENAEPRRGLRKSSWFVSMEGVHRYC